VFTHTLLPESVSEKLVQTDVKVDFGLYMDLSKSQRNQVGDILRPHEPHREPQHRSLNQTDASYTRSLPLLCSFEIQKEPGSANNLILWNVAHRARMEQLIQYRLGRLTRPRLHYSSVVHPGAMRPYPASLPCVRMCGIMWELYFYGIDGMGGNVMCGPLIVGKMHSMFHMYRIFNVLADVFRYAYDDYWPWFLDYVLDFDGMVKPE
jgi:hypothetical protein